ncbi:MAG TPA: alpha-1,4-glucan--maltose-1-phosphate maltosyltransferase [Candidatus Limnocylindrales bacterium]
MPDDGRRRVVIENVAPQIDGGRFPVKRIVGDTLVVEADVFADGHDEVSALVYFQPPDDGQGRPGLIAKPMEALGNDRWRSTLYLETPGRYEFYVEGTVDHYTTWQHDLEKKIAAGQDVTVDRLIGEQILARSGEADVLASRTRSDTYAVTVDPPRAGFSAWYELFPRSASPDPKRHGTFKDVVARLDYVSGLGFNVLYLPPIHPIGRQFRKGPNNTASSNPADPGVAWAIGGPEGGHTAVNPDLGTLDDFDALVATARAKDIDIALDIAFQASPDHPWVTEHPEWFRKRPDGTIQYAENPPKKYQDIYPFDFESSDWRGLWQALNDVFRFWIGHGVTTFRVDNPHTKAFAFWEWCIADIKRDHPEAIFLAEAFTRPRPMHRLAKLGFSQSYTYFTWRNTAAELRTYMTELTALPAADYFRPNFWPNTPDILHADLQHGGRAAFMARVVLAATLSSNYGIYGPPYELMEAVPREAGSEEYLDSEKYQQRTWDLARADSLAPLITALNAARRDHPALQSNERLVFHDINSDWLLAYSKTSADGRDVILAVVNMDYHATRAGTLVLDLEALGLAADSSFEAHDLLDGATYTWRGARNWVSLDPEVRAAHLLLLRRP